MRVLKFFGLGFGFPVAILVTLFLFMAITGLEFSWGGDYRPVIKPLTLFEGDRNEFNLTHFRDGFRLAVDFDKTSFVELYEDDKKFLRLEKNPNSKSDLDRFLVSFYNKPDNKVSTSSNNQQAAWLRNYEGNWNYMDPWNFQTFAEQSKQNDLSVLFLFGGMRYQLNPLDKNKIPIDIEKRPKLSNKAEIPLFGKIIPWKISAITDQGKTELIKSLFITHQAIYFSPGPKWGGK